MLSLLLVSLYEFKQFLQIVLWIALPLTIVAIGITTFLHYRRKKKRAGAEPAYQDIGFHTVMAADDPDLPDWLVGSTQPDNTSLLKKYEQEVRRTKENYTILEDDFRKLEKKYSDLLNKAYNTEKQDDDLIDALQQEINEYKQEISRLKQAVAQEHASRELAPEAEPASQLSENHEQETAQMQRYFALQLENLGKQYNTDKNELTEQLTQTQQLLASAEAENSSLKEEKTALKEKLHELQYLQDVVQEKKLNIDFLQNQLEQRIKAHHQLEQEVDDKTGQLQHLQSNFDTFDQQINSLKEELLHKQQEITTWQQAADNNREQNEQQKDILREKITRIENLELNLQELQQQQAALQSVIADKQDAIMQLQESVSQEQHKVHELESKLEVSNQLLVKIYTELAKSFSAGLMQLQNGAVPDLLVHNNSNGHLNAVERNYHLEEAV